MSHDTSNPTTGLSRRQILKGALVSAGGFSALGSAPELLASAYTDPVATTRTGKIRGYREAGVHIFKGIPYAADTRHRRFQPAAAAPQWRGVRPTTQYGSSAPQTRPNEPLSEECLFLNVWTPGLRDQGSRPVIVYIHGGGYTNGSGSGKGTDGINLCLQGDVVVVTLNHRINAFGYLYLADLGGKEFAYSGNTGQLDIIMALQWIRDHAAEFGGNPDNITLAGQSGGGAKISTLMAMPAAHGLFHKAVTMSGQQVTAAGPRAATQRAELFLSALNLKPSDVQQLLTLPMEQLIEATQIRDFSRIENRGLEFLPVMDSLALPRHPFYPDAPAQSAHIPMIIGNTRDETRAFSRSMPEDYDLDWKDLPERIRNSQYVDIHPNAVIAEYRRLYPDYSASDIYFAATTAGRSWRGAIIQAEERAKQNAPAFVYQLDWGSPADGGRYGAGHGSDVPLMFDNVLRSSLPRTAHTEAQRIADQMSGALIAMAKTGNPSHSKIPPWKPYSLENRETLIFDMAPTLGNDPRGAERKFYAQVPFIQRGTF